MNLLWNELSDRMRAHRSAVFWREPETMTYAEALRGIDERAGRLARSGFREGERVLLRRENDTAWPLDFLAVLAAGGVVLPVDPHLTEGEMANLREHSGARWSVEPAGPRRIEAPDAPPLPNGTCVMMYSSGTTGMPKAVPLTETNLLANLESLRAKIDIRQEDRMLCLLPFHHAFALTVSVLAPVAAGASLGIAPPLKPRELLAAWGRMEPTFVLAVPALLRLVERLVQRGGTLPSGVRGIVAGGAACPVSTMQALEAAGFPVLQGYGMTEASPVISANAPGESRLGSVGRPLKGVEVRLSASPEGEILVRGANVMPGYYRDPEKTAEVLRDGWLHTGDLGRIDADGYLSICGRSKNLILSDDGKNIYPEEIESALAASPLFAELCVVGRPVADAQERIAAVLVPGEAMAAVPASERPGKVRAEVDRLCAQLAPYKRVQEIFLKSDPLPKTPTMKVRRPEILRWLAGQRPL
ncbi:MAG: AMP-binding protein [Planctomycetes bacterium]|nr:AMP-binding protein [Planctomycetota bacterium]